MHLRTDTSREAHFAAVPSITKSRNSFSIADKHVTTIQFDKIYPIYHKFIYPGDTLSITEKIMARLSTQVGTLYDDLYFDVHSWFVPMRLIQTDWARYQFNAQPGGPSQDNSALESPKVDLATLPSGKFESKSLYDYFGYPTEIDFSSSGQHINNYLPRAYHLIWNDNYRDENLQNPAQLDLDNGADSYMTYVVQQRGKRHDKFTSALTAQQKGTGAVLPLGTSAPVVSTGDPLRIEGSSGGVGNMIYSSSIGLAMSNSPPNGSNMVWGGVSGDSGLEADLTNAVAASLNALRTTIAIQHLLEADARGGTRDVEAIQNRWGVTVPDFRLQRPEYLGGQTFTFDGHVVPQTSESGTTPQGTLKQFSQAMSQMNVTHSFVEHGVFMMLISARSNITYQQGLSRELSYKTRYDWFQPEFANLGEVAIKNKEIFAQGNSSDDETFGFQEYGYELRYSENRVSSEMRSNYTTSRDHLHMADDYSSLPTLSSTFIENQTPISRNIAVAATTADPIELSTFVQGKIARTLPMYSIPGLTRI